MSKNTVCTALLATTLFFDGGVSVAKDAGHLNVNLEHMRQLVEQEISWNWKLPDNWVVVFEAGKAGYNGMTYVASKKITLWVRPADTPRKIAAVYVHELAHAFSHLYFTEKNRTDWLQLRGLPQDTVWYPLSGSSDFASGEGDFAECVSWTFQKFSFDSKLGPPPNDTQQEFIRAWLETLPRRTDE